MADWPELTHSDTVPGEPATLPDGRPTRVTRAPAVGKVVSGPLADLTRPERLGESFRAAMACSLEDVTAPAEMGRAVLLTVNLGVVRDRVAEVGLGDTNAVVGLAGVAREPETGVVQGLWLTDGREEWFATDEQLTDGWLSTGGWMLYSNHSRDR